MGYKQQLQYERDYCNMICDRGIHAERVASSGARRKSVCDAITFSLKSAYLTEIKSTKKKVFKFIDTHGIFSKANSLLIECLLCIYFKSSHSSKGKGRWVIKKIYSTEMVVRCDDECDEF